MYNVIIPELHVLLAVFLLRCCRFYCIHVIILLWYYIMYLSTFLTQEVNVSDALSTLDSVDIGGIQELVDNATHIFSNISGLIEDELGDFGV